MAALLVGLSVMAVMLSIALPAWSHLVRREREEELIFRGNQYARAIALYQRTRANAFPTSIDQLIEQRLLRKKYKDPLSPSKDGEFQLIFQSQLKPQGQPSGTGLRGTGIGSPGGGASTVGTPVSTFQSTSGPIVGVVSKNTGTSIKTYKGKQKYSEWQFTSMEMSSQAGAGGAGGGSGRGGGRDGRGGDGRGLAPPSGRSGDRSFTTPDRGTTFTPMRSGLPPPRP